VRAFVRRVAAPVLLVLADDGPFGRMPLYDEMIGLLADVEVVRLPGGHHLHLEGAEAEIAGRIRAFLG
jgi:pimeloyl-ACP methyl ester carboxylesterase